MDKSDGVKFAQLWALGYENYGKTPSDALTELAFDVLSNHSFDDIKRAVMTHIQTSPYAPKPSDINQLIGGDPDSRKLKSWTMVEETIRRVGGYESVVFPDDGIMAVIDEMGGWVKMCSVTNEELPFIRNEFIKRYAPYLNKSPDEYPRRLSGIAEQANQLTHPDHVQLPKLIGDPELAKLVYQGGGAPRLAVTNMPQSIKKLTEK